MPFRETITVLAAISLVACGGAPAGTPDAGTPDAGTPDAGTSTDAGAPDLGARRGAAAWIREHLAGTNELTGDHSGRTTVETPALVHDAMGCCGKYAFDVHEDVAPDDRRVGFVNVTVTALTSTDAYGAGISSAYAPGLVLYLADVTVDPMWPTWVDYATTNYDGLVLDDAAAIYAEDLTVRNWNADAGIDCKAPSSQFVRLTLEGHGNRGIRYWTAGPHYLVDSHLSNDGTLGDGVVMWFEDCDTAEVRIYGSTFDGATTVPAGAFSCNNGTAPTFTYLTTDPRTTGEMHEMFSY